MLPDYSGTPTSPVWGGLVYSLIIVDPPLAPLAQFGED